MSRFNLIDEKWIPVRMRDGTRTELGIQDTLLNAKEIAEIEDQSPLVVASLYRFLLAVLYRALEGPTDGKEAKVLFRTGLPTKKIKDYLKAWKDRFWLFDEKYPFGQNSAFNPETWRTWPALAFEHNADNAKVLFDHVDIESCGTISEAMAVRWLLATQTFAVSCGKSELAHTGTAPSAGSIMAIPIGVNLMDTCLFCLVPQNRLILDQDIPVWEKKPESIKYFTKPIKMLDKISRKLKNRAVERNATGIIDVFTWQSRSILFNKINSAEISEVGIASGIGYRESTEIDPMIGYSIMDVKDEDSKEKMKKRIPIHFGNKEFWRAFDSLLPDDAKLAPRVIENARELTRKNQDRCPKGVMILGQRYYPPRPNIAYWRKEYFVLPEALVSARDIRTEIHHLLSEADQAQTILYSSCCVFARNLLSRGERVPDQKDISKFVKQMPINAWYWSTLESWFHEILSEYTLDRDPEDIRCQWLKNVRDTLRLAWARHRASVSMGDAWAIRALVKAEGPVNKKMKELDIKIYKYEPQKEAV